MTETLTPAPTILSVTDTREYVEIDDRFVPVSGSGTVAHCQRCGRGHEVHVVVEHTDGRIETVGTGCAGRGDAYGRKVGTSAAAVARLRAEVARHTANAEAYDAALAEVTAVPVPAHTVAPFPSAEDPTNERGRFSWTLPGTTVRVVVDRWSDTAERTACLADAFRSALLRDRFGDRTFRMSRSDELAESAVKRLAAAERRLAEVTR